MTITTVPAVEHALGPVELDLLRRAANGTLRLDEPAPQIEALWDASLLRPSSGHWDLGRGVRLCEICGRPGDSRECTACVLVRDIELVRSTDI